MHGINLINLPLQIIAAFLALALHEMVKARCSTILGDPTPKAKGLLSGNPFKYIEPIGFIITVAFGFGWGRPTPTSPLYYKERNKGIFITYFTPSLANLFVGLLISLIAGAFNFVAAPAMVSAPPAALSAFIWTHSFLRVFAQLNIGIALFNMIPVPPLDAARLLQAVLPPNAAVKMTQNEKMLQLMLVLLVVVGVVGSIIHPVTQFLMFGF
ncbi:MAG: site-2 protease family protein [Defluviitaleaceae bacterium]|nr:site-2 protease family protein [Defluviitaleaceae bacterium]